MPSVKVGMIDRYTHCCVQLTRCINVKSEGSILFEETMICIHFVFKEICRALCIGTGDVLLGIYSSIVVSTKDVAYDFVPE